MDWRLYIAPIFVLWLLAMLYVGPSYFRRLGQFISRLESHHEGVFEELGRPSLSLTAIRVGNSWSTVWFVARKAYRQLGDDEIDRLGDSVWIRLMFCNAGAVFTLIAFPLAAPYRPY